MKNVNFLSRITDINEPIDIYIGQNAGKQLNEEILRAKQEVLIVSPYIDEKKLNDLFYLKNRGVSIKLMVSDLKGDDLKRREQYKRIIHKLISQHKITDEKAKSGRDKKIIICYFGLILSFVLGIMSLIYFVGNFPFSDSITSQKIDIVNFIPIGAYLFLAFISYSYYHKSKNKGRYLFYLTILLCAFSVISLLPIFIPKTILSENSEITCYFLLGIVFIITSYLLWLYRNRLKKTPIYSYEYTQNIDFKYIRDTAKFIHSKIYIIDRRVAYLGSLNYTNNGFTTNFETRIKISQKEKIDELVNFVNEIFNDNLNFMKHENYFLGRQVYTEEKY